MHTVLTPVLSYNHSELVNRLGNVDSIGVSPSNQSNQSNQSSEHFGQRPDLTADLRAKLFDQSYPVVPSFPSYKSPSFSSMNDLGLE